MPVEIAQDRAALEAAAASWINMRVDPMPRACRAYHKAMIEAMPGLCVHEPDGTVRTAKDYDWPGIDLLREQVAEATYAAYDAHLDRKGTP